MGKAKSIIYDTIHQCFSHHYDKWGLEEVETVREVINRFLDYLGKRPEVLNLLKAWFQCYQDHESGLIPFREIMASAVERIGADN